MDDLGEECVLPASVARVVSLVPSLTESVASVRADALAGVTDWCTHPADLAVTRVRGTKNPNVRQIIDLAPDVVLANKEENRAVDVAALRAAGVPVWVTRIETLDEGLTSLRRLFTDALAWPVPAWLDRAERSWSRPPPFAGERVVIPVWRDPWMVVGSATFTGDLAGRLGLVNVFAGHSDRYPHVSLEEIAAAAPDLVVLPDEPYLFTAADGPEAFPEVDSALVEGRSLTWYGPSLANARDTLVAQLSDRSRFAG